MSTGNKKLRGLSISGIGNIMQKFVNVIYRRIFHEEISSDVQIFLKNLLYVGVATVISTLCTSIFNIMGGRWLGPEEYGKYILIQSIAMFLYIPMELGFNTAMLKYTSEKADYQRQSNIIISTLLLASLMTVLTIIIYIIIGPLLSRLFAIQLTLFYLAVAFAALFVFYALTTSALRGLNRMRAYSIFQIVYGTVILFSFLALILDKQLSFKTMIFPMLLSYASVIILIYIFFIRKLAKWKFDVAISKMLSKYSLMSALGGLSYTFYTNIDRIMISKYMTVTDVGIYAAYYMASVNVAGLFWGMFNLVFFPTISGYQNKAPVYKKINKFIPYLIGLGIPFVYICEFVILKLYGVKYSLNLFWMVYFAVASICIVIDGLYAWLLQAIGLHGARITAFSAVAIAVINAGLNLILIPKFGIPGAIISLTISYVVAIVMKLIIGRDYLSKGVDKEASG